jgi:5-methylthioadenosine/S-adenosylhomocysteine deaminase
MLLKNGKALIGLELKKCDIRIENGIIKEISENLVPLDNEEVVDLTGKIITPGFVNTHTHVAMSLLRGYAEDLPFKEWLLGKILPAEEKLTPEAVYYGSLVSMMEMAAHGVVAFCDMYFHEDMVAKAVADFGLKALLTRGLVDIGGDDNGRLEENLKLFRKWNGYEDRIYVGLGPHAPYSCSKSYLSKIVDIAKIEDVPVTMHFFENAWEYEMYTPREIMDIGFHEVHFIPVHCTQLKREDIRLLDGSFPSINTVSNMKLGNGIPPVTEMLKNGIKITIGTDGPASNNSQNLLLDLRISVLAQKSYSPENFKVEEAFNALTKNGYSALRLTGGTIEVGSPADFAIFEASHIQLQPIDNFLQNLIHAYTDRVYATMVNGRFVYINGLYPTVDVEEVLEKFSTFSRMVTGIES